MVEVLTEEWEQTLSEKLDNLFTIPSTAPRIPAMEGLRGFAVLLVFLVHYSSLFGYLDGSASSAAIAYLFRLGNSGVDVFFILSGVLIYGGLWRPQIRWRRYFRRRIQRIYPVFVTVLLLAVLLTLAGHGEGRIPSGNQDAALYLLANVALLPGLFTIRPLISVAWSLSYEMFFYLSVPLLVILLKQLRVPRWGRIAFLMLLAIVYLMAHRSYGTKDWPSALFPIFSHARLTLFAAGMIVSEISGSARITGWLLKIGDLPVLLAYLAGAVVMLVTNLPRTELVLASAPLLVFRCLAAKGFLNAAATWRPMRWLGNMSYSYFLLHGFLLHGVLMVFQHFRPSAAPLPFPAFWIGLPFCVLITAAGSAVLFLAIEKPFSFPQARGGRS